MYQNICEYIFCVSIIHCLLAWQYIFGAVIDDITEDTFLIFAKNDDFYIGNPLTPKSFHTSGECRFYPCNQ